MGVIIKNWVIREEEGGGGGGGGGGRPCPQGPLVVCSYCVVSFKNVNS